MKKNDRIWELDALRGVCILCVIAVHLIYDLGFFIGLDLHLPAWYVFIQQYGGVIFVILSGCCATLGSRSFRRGCIVFACGLLISLVTFGMYRLGMATRDVIVWFGVLYLLGVCMMLYPVYRRLPTPALAAIGIVLVVAGYLIAARKGRIKEIMLVIVGLYAVSMFLQSTCNATTPIALLYVRVFISLRAEGVIPEPSLEKSTVP